MAEPGDRRADVVLTRLARFKEPLHKPAAVIVA
jgi:hypothetical protein